MKDKNKIFNVINVLTDKQVAILIAEQRLFGSKAEFYGWEISKINNDGNNYSDDLRTYEGTFFTNKPNDYNEAKKIVELRGFNEYDFDVIIDMTDGEINLFGENLN
jgi:hypothetical protein